MQGVAIRNVLRHDHAVKSHASCALGLLVVCAQAALPPTVTDGPFPQEIARRISTPPEASGPRVPLLDLSAAGEIRFFAAGRWYAVDGGRAVELPALQCEADGEFVLADASDRPVRVPVPWAEVRQILRKGDLAWLATRADPLAIVDGHLRPLGWPSRWEVRQIALGPDGALWVASSGGLFRQQPGGWEPVGIPDGHGRGWAVEKVLGVAFDNAGRLWVGIPAGVAMRDSGRWRFWEGRDGLPYSDFTRIMAASNGDVWFGTRIGAIRFDGKEWAYRQGPRWLPGEEVMDIAIDRNGMPWFATSGGLGAIESRPMTLAAKAASYEEEIGRCIKRTEFGYTSEVHLAQPGDRSRITWSDSDNDGLWTAMYGAGECFAYAALRRPEFERRARQAFEALRFLQKVTQGGPHSPPRGFVARTIRPVDWPDPNEGRLEADRRMKAEGDRLWKVYSPRWPKSADGRWYWKGDTSSDELDGHYFFYARYYDLVADGPEKERVREVVRELTDHLMAHDFCLVDHDGTPTRWAVFSPKEINHNPQWWVERGLNSLSILSYLAVAEHMTGDAKYVDASRELIERHGYGANVMHPKVQMGVGSGNQSDDEMAFMCFYNLLSYSRDPVWRDHWLAAFHAYAALEQPEMNPFFNFAYAAHGRGETFSTPWGDYSLDPGRAWLEDSMSTLRGFPLDRANWPHRNSHRLDLIRLPLRQSGDLYSARERARGHRVDGKVLPVAERHFNHWNTDPWRLDYGGDGRELASGTVFLLPYYMGLHHGFIASDAR
jgi:hypothetical protein